MLISNINLNTSHVKVKPIVSFRLLFPLLYLNTSHVKVKLEYAEEETITEIQFKYISC